MREHGFPHTFNDFDFTMENEVYSLNVHDSADNDNIIVIDYSLNKFYKEGNDEEVEFHQMLLSSKEMFKEVLTTFFKFDEEDVKDALNDIGEDEDSIDFRMGFYRLAIELINTQNYSVNEVLDMMGVSNEYERKILRSKLEEEI